MVLEKEIKRITGNLLGKIPSDLESYTPKDLLNSGVPSKVIEHIRNSIEPKVIKDLKAPSSKWVKMDSDLMRVAWIDFLKAAISNSCIPKSTIKTVMVQAVAEMFPIFLEPRARLTDYLFGKENELTYDEIVGKTNHLTVYKHFASAIPLYMKKRKLDTLTKKRCNILIQNLDEKLVSTYTAIHWGQKLDLLFKMYNDEVDTHLLAMFFKDKRMEKVADFFEDMTGEISKKEFVQILTSPEDAKRIMQRFKEKVEEDEDIVNSQVEKISREDEQEQGLIDSFFGNYEYTPINEEKASKGKTLADSLKDNVLSKSEVDELVHEIQVSQESSESKKHHHKDGVQSSSITSFLEQAADSMQKLEDDDPFPPREEQKEEVVFELSDSGDLKMGDEESDGSVLQDDDGSENEPAWKQFLTNDHIDMVIGDKKNTSDTDASQNQDLSGLTGYLFDEKDKWVDQIFLGAEYAYDEALEDLSSLKKWDDATNYIKKSIFDRNDIDITSEIAIEFTDKLQSYFNK